MFSTFRKFFGKRAENVADEESPFSPAALSPSSPKAPRQARPEAPARPTAMPASAPSSLAVPLSSILNRLPPELQQRVRQMEVGDSHVSIPMQKIFSQIAQGCVKITFGELRRLSPPGTFTHENDRDNLPVELPLHEVLSRLGPGILPRRTAQKQVSVPAEVAGPFGGQAQVMFSANPVKPVQQVASAQPTGRVQAPTVLTIPQKFASTVQPTPSTQTSFRSKTAPAPVPVPSTPPARSVGPVVARVRTPASNPSAAPVRPAMATQIASVGRSAPATDDSQTPDTFFRNAPAPAPEQPIYSPIASEPLEMEHAPIAMPGFGRAVSPSAPISPIAPEVQEAPAPIPFQILPSPAAEPSFAGETVFITLSLAEIARGWPEPVLREIVEHQMTTSALGLPYGAIEHAMKQGKIVFTWRVVRSWIKPPVFVPNSALDGTLLEFPLRIIAPLFLGEMRTSKRQRKIVLDESIPDLFSGKPQSENVPAAPAIVPAFQAKTPPASAPSPRSKPTDTNYFAKNANEAVEETAPVVKKGPSPGTAFLVRYATPNEIISKAAALDGVDGALIALPDGLLVASQLPQSMNADTVAAFLPQIFGRVTQCTKELRLGELNNLNFTVGSIPWKIFKVGAIYFAAFGRAGEPLPSAQLAGIAAELDRKGK